MANCSIPNWRPATGRSSTTSSRPLKKQSESVAAFGTFRLTRVPARNLLRSLKVQRSTLNAQRSTQMVGRWALDVGRWTFSSLRRVKGAWWPSRSSKPSLPCKWQGGFDSYPLRHDCSTLNVQRSTSNVQFRQLGVGRSALDVGRFLLPQFERR